MKSRLTPLPDWNPDDIKQLGLPVKRVEIDSRRVLPGDVFLACPGLHSDGRDYIQAALAKGAAAVLGRRRRLRLESAVAGAQSGGAESARAHRHAGGRGLRPSQRALRVIGITGTNGKISISHWLAQAFAAGPEGGADRHRRQRLYGELTETTHTTPDR